MYRLRRSATIPLLIASCYSPNTPIVIDGDESPTSGGLGTTGADSTGASRRRRQHRPTAGLGAHPARR
jgi:hypothetical protein